jgi:organic hydroperoxide reductase OsmC/OhrA
MAHEHKYKLTAVWTGNKGDGSFKEVTLNPICYVADESMVEKAIELHHKAHEICYIANSVNFEVKCNPTCKVE